MSDRDNPITSLMETRAGMLPADWNRLSAPEKIQKLYGECLDSAWVDLTYRGEDKTRLLIRNNVRHDVMMICAKFALANNQAVQRSKVLEMLAEGLAQSSGARSKSSRVSGGKGVGSKRNRHPNTLKANDNS